MDDSLRGTSVIVSVPTLLYVGLAQRRNRIELLNTLGSHTNIKLENFLSVPYEFLPVAISIVYGISYKFLNRDSDDGDDISSMFGTRTLAVGSLVGLSLSLVGRFGLDLPVKMFGIPSGKEYTVHIIASVVYALFVYVSFLKQNA